MAERGVDIANLTADDLPALEADPSRCSRLAEWSVEEGAREAASLANSGGGVVVVGPREDLTAESLLAAGETLQPDGARLLSARILPTPDGAVGLLGVRECADPPVLAGEQGAIFRRGSAGSELVSTRAALDELITRRQRLRERAQRTVDAQIERITFGHDNYYTLALVVTPLLPGSTSRAWAREHQQAVLESALARRWNLLAGDVRDEGAVTEFRLPQDETALILTAGNGTLTIGQRDQRPALDRFMAPSDLAAWLDDCAEVARMLLANGDAGLVLPALFAEGLRELRLQAADGYGPPCSKDVQRTVMTPRVIETEDDRDALAAEMQETMGPLFGADLSSGTVQAYTEPVDAGPSARGSHGRTARTARRLAGQRGFGSAR